MLAFKHTGFEVRQAELEYSLCCQLTVTLEKLLVFPGLSFSTYKMGITPCKLIAPGTTPGDWTLSAITPVVKNV